MTTLYGTYGILFQKDLFHGDRYDGMSGMIPLIALFYFSLPLTLIALLVRDFMKKKQET